MAPWTFRPSQPARRPAAIQAQAEQLTEEACSGCGAPSGKHLYCLTCAEDRAELVWRRLLGEGMSVLRGRP